MWNSLIRLTTSIKALNSGEQIDVSFLDCKLLAKPSEFFMKGYISSHILYIHVKTFDSAQLIFIVSTM